jgi:hypothetical protein
MKELSRVAMEQRLLGWNVLFGLELDVIRTIFERKRSAK